MISGQIPIYIINLKRNPERKLFMQRQLDALRLKYCFIDVDIFDRYELESKTYRNRIAKLLDIDESVLERKYDATISTVESPSPEVKRVANIAIMLSHIQIYNSMIKNDIPVACILEDDATLLPAFPEILKTAAELEWDILMLASQPRRRDLCNKDLLFIRKKIKNRNAAKKQEGRINYLLNKYGINARLRPEQSEIFIKILQEYDTKYAELVKTTALDNWGVPLIKIKRLLYEHLKTHTLIRLGALPDKSSLELITKHHCIAKPRTKAASTIAYMLKQSVAMKWKRRALAENPLAIDRIPWQLYENEQVKLRIITPPCATSTYCYLKYSARRGVI